MNAQSEKCFLTEISHGSVCYMCGQAISCHQKCLGHIHDNRYLFLCMNCFTDYTRTVVNAVQTTVESAIRQKILPLGHQSISFHNAHSNYIRMGSCLACRRSVIYEWRHTDWYNFFNPFDLSKRMDDLPLDILIERPIGPVLHQTCTPRRS